MVFHIAPFVCLSCRFVNGIECHITFEGEPLEFSVGCESSSRFQPYKVMNSEGKVTESAKEKVNRVEKLENWRIVCAVTEADKSSKGVSKNG